MSKNVSKSFLEFESLERTITLPTEVYTDMSSRVRSKSHNWLKTPPTWRSTTYFITVIHPKVTLKSIKRALQSFYILVKIYITCYTLQPLNVLSHVVAMPPHSHPPQVVGDSITARRALASTDFHLNTSSHVVSHCSNSHPPPNIALL
jgi:hypothetical protein